MSDEQQLLTGQEVYDSIMASIEPDLVSTQLPLLTEKYANETDDEKTARMARYEAAFAKYDEEFAKFMEMLHGEVRAVRKDARDTAEMKDKEEEKKLEADLLSKMQAA